MLKILLFLFISIVSFNTFSQTISFTYSNANGSSILCSPALVKFTPIFTGNLIGYTWYFGNGQTSNSAIPTMAYLNGTYTVKLVAVFSNQALETTQIITINPGVTANITGNSSYICKLDTVGFTASSNTSGATYLFDFADGSPQITSASNTIIHGFTSFGFYTTSVRVTNIYGCVNSDSFGIEVKKPPITANVTPVYGCAPVTSNFNCSVVVPAGSSVSNYEWLFGDGSPPSNTLTGVVSHPYTDSGNFFPILNITTIEGCTNTFTFPNVNFGLLPNILYAYPDKTTYCGNESAHFIVKSDFATSYKWEFGDGSIQFTSDTIAVHKYRTLGPKIVKVTPINNQCLGPSFSFTINIIGVIADYSYANTCSSKNRFTFTNTSLGNQSFKEWDFDDGSPHVFTTNAIHVFPPSGAFNTMLAIADNITSCKDTIQYTIYTGTPVLTNPDNFVCRKSPATFTVINNYPNPALVFSWSVLGLPNSTDPSPYTVNATGFGSFAQSFVVINNGTQYCPDTVRLNKTVRVGGPDLSFATDTSFCTNNNFIVTNTSSPYMASDTIKTWNWTFGVPGLSDTAYQPAGFIYSAEGNYQIQLIAKDKKGCRDTLAKYVLVKESPFLRIFPRTDKICFGQTITLTAYHTDTLIWSPANMVSCATCDTTTATPINNTKIFAIASSPNGCSLKDSSIITVYKPFTATATPAILYGCINETANILVSPADKKVLWSPAFGLDNNTSYNPLITVLKDTSYLITLTDSAGCYSSNATIKIEPYPQPIVNAGADRILSYNSPFSLAPFYSPDVSNYLWTPAYNLSCSNCPKPSGFADSTRTFIINVSNANNCTAKDTINISIECAYANLYMASAFSPENNAVKKYYYPQTRGIRMINRFVVFNRYGEIVYETKNTLPNIRYSGWDGKYKGINQSAGGYVYMLDATCEKGEALNKKGSFLLIR